MARECIERIRLADKYSEAIGEYNARLQALKRSPQLGYHASPQEAAAAREVAQTAWAALEQHIAEHRCLKLFPPEPPVSPILAKAAAAALDLILVADDDRRYVDVNEAAARAIGLTRSEILGRRVEEFFSEAGGEGVPDAWASFVEEGVQVGICELILPGKRRRFEYRAKADFAPGLHLSILREMF